MSEKYDVVIIGAGIGGLVCGCYLAKAGLKVLIIEQHNKPGGCCTSFTRYGYRFDVGVHYLGSLKKGILRKMFDELEIDLKINRVDPTDKIIMPENITCIRTNPSHTKEEFKKSFPLEAKNIDKFFTFILDNDFLSVYRKIKKLTFIQVLDRFFNDRRIKATLNVLLGNIGLSAKIAAAVPSVILFKEYILDSGYYPIGGMQAFPNILVERFKKQGGELILKKKVIKIAAKDKPKRIVLNNTREILADIVVSNVDATLTYKNLLNIKTKESMVVDKLIPSPSMFMLYLGLKVSLEKIIRCSSNIWYFSTYDVDSVYMHPKENLVARHIKALLFVPSSSHEDYFSNQKPTAILSALAPYQSEIFWEKNKEMISEKMLAKVGEIVPNLRKQIDLQLVATPITIAKFTSNREGSFAGWLSTPSQIRTFLIPQRSSIRGFYTVGHWSTKGYTGGGGIPNVSFSGRSGAMLILEDLGKQWNYGDIIL